MPIAIRPTAPDHPQMQSLLSGLDAYLASLIPVSTVLVVLLVAAAASAFTMRRTSDASATG